MQTHLDSWQLGQEVQIKVDKAIQGGKFMGTAPDGKVAWLKSPMPLALGELVTTRVSKLAKRSYELEVITIDEVSEHRVAPFCPQVDHCGGCPWQALSTDEQVKSLSRDIMRMIERAVGQPTQWLAPFSDKEQAWRHTARLHSDGKGKLGFYGPQGLLDIKQCPVFTPNLNAILQDARSLIPLLNEAPSEIRISIAEKHSSGTLTLELHGIWPTLSIQSLQKALAQLIQSSSSLHGARLIAHREDLILKATIKSKSDRRQNRPKNKKNRNTSKHLARRTKKNKHSSSSASLHDSPLQIVDRIWGQAHNQLATASHPASAFMQAHQRGNVALVNEVIKGAEEALMILELYAGSGNFTLPLAKAHPQRQVFALEYDQTAVTSLNQYAQQEQLNIKAQAQNIASLPQGDFDHIILDPPRAGAAPIIQALADSNAKYITYISCHPAALARDLEKLCKQGWFIESAKLFHLFPHSGHAEVYCRLSKNH
ncbi:MAG: hypothetical protein CMH49_02895 [Myxococcales bacterium]|nr:hypothetical protein [Myxococcales bacterium]